MYIFFKVNKYLMSNTQLVLIMKTIVCPMTNFKCKVSLS